MKPFLFWHFPHAAVWEYIFVWNSTHLHRQKKNEKKNLKTFFSQIFYICLIYQSVFILALSKYNALQWSIKVLFTCSKYMQSVKLAGYQENLPSKSIYEISEVWNTCIEGYKKKIVKKITLTYSISTEVLKFISMIFTFSLCLTDNTTNQFWSLKPKINFIKDEPHKMGVSY